MSKKLLHAQKELADEITKRFLGSQLPAEHVIGAQIEILGKLADMCRDNKRAKILTQAAALLTAESLRADDPHDMEALAACEHESWSKWARYELDAIVEEQNRRHGVTFENLDCVQRWRRQLATSYEKLSPSEQESDRKVVREKLPVYRPEFKPPW
jgi:hypothetical protein